jgi:hypothetical protein
LDVATLERTLDGDTAIWLNCELDDLTELELLNLLNDKELKLDVELDNDDNEESELTFN